MQAILSITLLAALLCGCGATYTTFERASANNPNAGADDCPNGIDYKTGACL